MNNEIFKNKTASQQEIYKDVGNEQDMIEKSFTVLIFKSNRPNAFYFESIVRRAGLNKT